MKPIHLTNPYTFFKNRQLVRRPTRALTMATKPTSNLISTSPAPATFSPPARGGEKTILKLAQKGLNHGTHLPGYLGLGFSLANYFLNEKETNQKKPTENSTTDTPKTGTQSVSSQNNSLPNCSFQGKLTKPANTPPTLALTAEIGNSLEQPTAKLPKKQKTASTLAKNSQRRKRNQIIYLAQPKRAKQTAKAFTWGNLPLKSLLPGFWVSFFLLFLVGLATIWVWLFRKKQAVKSKR